LVGVGGFTAHSWEQDHVAHKMKSEKMENHLYLKLAGALQHIHIENTATCNKLEEEKW